LAFGNFKDDFELFEFFQIINSSQSRIQKLKFQIRNRKLGTIYLGMNTSNAKHLRTQTLPSDR